MRIKSIQTKITQEEFDLINEYCKKYGYSKSTLFRTSILKLIKGDSKTD